MQFHNGYARYWPKISLTAIVARMPAEHGGQDALMTGWNDLQLEQARVWVAGQEILAGTFTAAG